MPQELQVCLNWGSGGDTGHGPLCEGSVGNVEGGHLADRRVKDKGLAPSEERGTKTLV